jgi:hypothetical protein
VNDQGQQAEFVPFEIVRAEQRRVVFAPSGWKLTAAVAVGILALIGVIAVGFAVALVALLIAIPVMVIKAVASRFAPK